MKLNRKNVRGLFVSAALGLSLVVAGCGADEPEVGVGEGAEVGDGVGTAGTAEALVDIEDVVDNPATYAGRTVTVSGEVEEIYSPRGAFSLTGSGVIAENQLLVLAKAQPMVEEDKNVRVTGRVRAYAVADLETLERDLGWDFTPELEAELERVKTVMIAEQIVQIPG